MQKSNWDDKFYGICHELSTWSKCLSRQIGAIIVKDHVIISTGYNGPPRGIPQCGKPRIHSDFSLPAIPLDKLNMCPRQALGFSSGQGLELCTALHAEENAIINAARVGVSTNGCTMYMSCGIPCKECIKKIINAGIIEIVCVSVYDWYEEVSKFLVRNSNIKIRNYISEGVV